MLIEYKNATICQQDGEEVLKGVDFHADSGEFIYIIGRVGSGKSSLLKTFYQELDIEEADEATVLDYDMLSIRRKHVPALRRQMGIIFQDFQLLADRTVYKNLRFVLRATGWKKNEVDARIEKGEAKDTRTEAQKHSLYELLKELTAEYPDARIVGHCELPHVAKKCPCFPASTEYAELQPDARSKTVKLNPLD